jgi:phosphatidylinositol-3-phosphatase
MKGAKALTVGLLAVLIGSTALAHEGPVPDGMPRFDHIYVIMMENHSFQQVAGNPAMPFINSLISGGKASVAMRYYAVGHPSLTNYLEIVGGSNFGVRSDAAPDWHNANCSPNIATGIPNADDNSGTPPYPIDTGSVCPIFGTGKDALTEALDTWNETAPPVFNFLANIDGMRSVPAAPTVGKTIGDQLAAAGLSWKTYQENLPVTGADLINNSNGTATNLTTFDPGKPLSPTNLPPLSNSGPPCPAGTPVSPCPAILQAYAVKHNPFAYFRSVQEGDDPRNSLKNMVGFDGDHGLYADLAKGEVPSLAYIVPNQCDDQHGRGNGDAFCQFDQGIAALNNLTDGTQVGLNPGLSAQADTTMERIVRAIKHSPAWDRGDSAIVIVWDENDYSGLPALPPNKSVFPDGNQNRVVLTVETNGGSAKGVHSTRFYDSYSLLKSMEGAFRLSCLNHACDGDVSVMSDLFGRKGHW